MRTRLILLSAAISLIGCSGGSAAPKSAADRGREIDQKIDDVKSRTDIPPQAKADILLRLNRGRKASATSKPPESKG